MDCSPPGSSVHGILQAGILEWLPCPPPGDLPDPRIETTSLTSPALTGGFLTTSATTGSQPPVLTFKDPCDDIAPTKMIQGDLPTFSVSAD